MAATSCRMADSDDTKAHRRLFTATAKPTAQTPVPAKVEPYDKSVLIPLEELQAEHQRCQEVVPETCERPRRRRPRAGCYPLAFSPYRMEERRCQSRGAVQLDRRLIKNDFEVS